LINARLTNNKITTNKIKRDKGFINLVTNTWAKVLEKERDTPNDWLHDSEVLVDSR
jgi:hypothetical protein